MSTSDDTSLSACGHAQAGKSKKIKERDIQKLSILRSLKPLLQELHGHADCFNRTLHYDQYVSLTLLYFFNPILTALRSIQQPSSFVMRFRDNASYETIEERALSEADRKVGIEFDRVAWLGSKQKRDNLSRPVRIIQIHYYDERVLSGYKRKSRVSSKKTFRTRSHEHTLLIATDRMDLPAELIGLIYRYRWQTCPNRYRRVELFFRWFKCILGCQHLSPVD